MAFVVQLQAVLGGEAFVAMLTEMCFRLRLMRLVVVNNNLRLLSGRLSLVLLHDLNRADGRLLLLTRDCRVDDRLLLRHLHFVLRLMLLQHRRRNALNLLNDLLSIGVGDDLNWNW